jgi:hypothetical protein
MQRVRVARYALLSTSHVTGRPQGAQSVQAVGNGLTVFGPSVLIGSFLVLVSWAPIRVSMQGIPLR